MQIAALVLRKLLGQKDYRIAIITKGSDDGIQSSGSLLQSEWRENYSSNNITDLKRVAIGKQNLNPEKTRLSLLDSITGPGQFPWYLKELQSDSGTVLILISFRIVKYNVVYDRRIT